MALACREMGCHLSAIIEGRFSSVSEQVCEMKTNIELILSGLSLLLGADWQARLRKVLASSTEAFDIYSCSDSNSIVGESQPDGALSQEKESVKQSGGPGMEDPCVQVLDFGRCGNLVDIGTQTFNVLCEPLKYMACFLSDRPTTRFSHWHCRRLFSMVAW